MRNNYWNPITGVVLLIIIVITTNTIKDYNLEKDKIQTKGIITNFRYNSSGNFQIKYSYFVDSMEYVGTKSVLYFKSDDGVQGCVGREFNVLYSKNNPKNSEIDLEEFNDKKFSSSIYSLIDN